MLVSVLGFGASEIGFEGTAPQVVDQLLGHALDAGINVIDTAECYQTSEERIGQAVAHRRQDYYLFSKCGHAAEFDYPDWHPKLLELSIERSLKRLKTDYLDLIQLHSCSAEVLRQGDVIEVLQRAKAQGKVRYVGYSGDHTDAQYAVSCQAFDTLQSSISIADQEAIQSTLNQATACGMGVIAKRPIANVAWKHPDKPANIYHQPYWFRLRELNYDFLQAELDEAVGIALRFTLSLPGVHTAIVGTTNPSRWVTNIRHVEQGKLPEHQMFAIRARWKAAEQSDWIGLT